ncbi:beta-eliminating lyase-related protein [Streptomyces sp. NPDC047108]|uniref:threonine aldolase family protein n=1 Tax=Streptomyces sp. NPDC047108 TaxID=3155025 RepID=UPI0033C203BA
MSETDGTETEVAGTESAVARHAVAESAGARPGVAEPGSGAADPGERPGPDAGADARPDRERARRCAAWRGAERALVRGHQNRTVREGLAALAAYAPDAYDLDEVVDLYGDGIVGALERRVAGLLGTEAAAFFPTGTMAQQVALRCWAGRTGNPAVALHPLAHPEMWERDAFSTLSGLRTVHPTTQPRLPTAEEVRELGEPFGALMLELPLREPGFVLPTWEELTAVVEAARERDAVVHFDGARLWECASHFGRALPEIAALADSVYVSFYKSLGGISGAALAGPQTLIDEALAWRHRYGGQLFQQWPAALAALNGLDRELPRLPEYVAHAKIVAQALGEALTASGLPWHRIHPAIPHTHQFQVWLPYPPDVLDEVSLRQAEETRTTLFHRWNRAGPGLAVTEMTVGAAGLDWTDADVAEAVAVFVERLRSEQSRATGSGSKDTVPASKAAGMTPGTAGPDPAALNRDATTTASTDLR